MDERELGQAQQELIAWGLLEPGALGVSWTRRFRGAVMRAAGELANEERAGRKPEGPPLANAVRAALKMSELPAGAQATRVHEQLLLAVELAALPEPLRDLLGG
ncbi:MAG: hypothetical protein LC624_05605 [Halobacteriales archaeon]|nr:hypothetical protein [Halobacteriales archaeon]